MENSFEEVAVVFFFGGGGGVGGGGERGEQAFSKSSMHSWPLILKAAEAWGELIETHKAQPPATFSRKCLVIRPKKGWIRFSEAAHLPLP